MTMVMVMVVVLVQRERNGASTAQRRNSKCVSTTHRSSIYVVAAVAVMVVCAC